MQGWVSVFNFTKFLINLYRHLGGICMVHILKILYVPDMVAELVMSVKQENLVFPTAKVKYLRY